MATKTSPPSSPINGFIYKTEVTSTSDGGLKTVTSKSSTAAGPFSPVTSTIVDKTGKAGDPTFDFPGVTNADKAAFNNPNSSESKSRSTQIESTQIFGPNPTAAQQTLVNGAAGKLNAATTAATAAATAAAAAAEAVSSKKGTRTSYGGAMKYPIGLALESQDVIKFSILEYTPSLAGAAGRKRVVTLEGGSPIVEGSKRIGVITLPIPAGIYDSNTVGWNNDSLNMLQEAAGRAADTILKGGTPEKAGEEFQGKVKEGVETGDFATALRGKFASLAAQSSGLAQRTQGAVLNNNVELLFSGPSLRSFSFTFMFYPRSSPEAKMVKQIIRTFKQAMSVKRSESSLLLKSPHTFAISYMTAGQDAHPYLNSFKECALTSCGVEYTPDGTYMTYGNSQGEKSMTAYRLSLSFQELEPIFDDEYSDDNDATIGF
jgi:hypothetical protein